MANPQPCLLIEAYASEPGVHGLQAEGASGSGETDAPAGVGAWGMDYRSLFILRRAMIGTRWAPGFLRGLCTGPTTTIAKTTAITAIIITSPPPPPLTLFAKRPPIGNHASATSAGRHSKELSLLRTPPLGLGFRGGTESCRVLLSATGKILLDLLDQVSNAISQQRLQDQP